CAGRGGLGRDADPIPKRGLCLEGPHAGSPAWRKATYGVLEPWRAHGWNHRSCQSSAVPLGARIGLAVPGRPTGPWLRRTGAPEGVRDQTGPEPDAPVIAHGTRCNTR